MSDGPRLPFAEALALAESMVRDLAPAVKWCKVAGSLRRRRPDVGDVEIVVVPSDRELLGVEEPDVEAVRAVAAKWGTIVTAERKQDQQHTAGLIRVRLREPAGFTSELWVVTPPADPVCILAIRTGPARLGAEVMARLNRRGYRHVGGHIERRESRLRVDVADEAAFFSLAGLPCLPPSRRDSEEALRPVADRLDGAVREHEDSRKT